MKEGPNIAALAALIGDPARANMLTALMHGHALTASELAAEAGVTLQTASAHLAKLAAGRLVAPRKQGRHRYFQLADDEVAGVLESLMGLAAGRGPQRKPGPKEPALRRARVCYDHLAGELGVAMFDALTAKGALRSKGTDLILTPSGEALAVQFGIDVGALRTLRRPLCMSCLDWSARRSHLAGALGAAFLNRFYELNWARKDGSTRAVLFSKTGEMEFKRTFATKI